MLSHILLAIMPELILILTLAVLTAIVIVTEVIAALKRHHARKNGHPGVGLAIREDPSAKRPDDETKTDRVGMAGADTVSDMQGGDQPGSETAKLDMRALGLSLDEADQSPTPKKPAPSPAPSALPTPLSIPVPTAAAAAAADETRLAVDELMAAAMEASASLPTPEPLPPATDAPPAAVTAPVAAATAAAAAAAAVAPTPAPPSSVASSAADAGSGSFDLVLQGVGSDQAAKIDAIRVVRSLSGAALFQAMQMVDALPAVVMRDKSRPEVEAGLKKLQAIGATAEIRDAEPRDDAAASAAQADPAAPEPAELPEEPTDEALESMAAAAKAGRKKRKTFKEYEDDRRKELAQREREKAERQANYRDRLQREVLFVGRGVSAGLAHSTYDSEKLKRFSLPRLGSAEDVAQAMAITPAKMRWLCFHREDATCEHYSRFTIPKRSGGEREISSPKPELRKAQSWVLENILSKIAVHAAAHGFVPGRSTVSNATPHVRAAVLIKLDVKDFFPSITFHRVKGLFYKSLGFGESASTVLALICTEPPRVTAEYDESQYRVAVGDRQLPQGACTSPALTNIICRKLDARLSGLARKYGFTYTRYADDITFSGPTGDSKVVGQVLGGAKRILKSEGLQVHGEKYGVHRRGRQQRVTGIVVNEKPSLDRRALRNFRALLHDALKNGPDAANRGRWPNFMGYLQGYTAYLHMIDAEKAKPFRAILTQIQEKHFPNSGTGSTTA